MELGVSIALIAGLSATAFGVLVVTEPFITTKGLEAFEVEVQKLIFENQTVLINVTSGNTTIEKEIVVQVPKNITVLELPEKPIHNSNEIENKIFILVNKERNKVGVSSLILDQKLSNIAKGHSQNMIDTGIYSHKINGLEVKDRMEKNSYVCNNPSWEKQRHEVLYQYNQARDTLVPEVYFDPNYYAMENLNQVWIYEEDPAQELVNEWIASPNHYKAMTYDPIDVIGIGVVIDNPNNKIYATLNFC